MKKLTKALILIFSLATLILGATAPSFAVSTNAVNLTLTPLPAATSGIDQQGATISSTDNGIMTDWSTTGTGSKSMFWGLSLADSILSAQCIDGSGAPKVIGFGGSTTVTAADPNSTTDENYIFVNFLNFTGPYAISPGGAGGGSSDTEVGTSGGFGSFVTPFDLSSVNDAGFASSMHHVGDGTTSYSVTTKVPVLYLKLSCEIEDGTQGLGGSAPPETTIPNNSAKSPKTGASEVLLGTFLVALLASSFVVYKAMKKHRETKQFSEK